MARFNRKPNLLVQPLAQLPELLQTKLTETNLNQTLQLSYIDGSKFIDRHNPASNIYRQMTKQGCPKSSDGKPKNMADLQDYWEDLIAESHKRPILIFYENPTPPAPQGFSPTFLNALSRFEGSICLICDPPHPTIPCFSLQDPHLIQSMLTWLQGTMGGQGG